MEDMPRSLFVFPDTNVLVQCKPIGELDWNQFGDYSRIVLLLARPVIAEIDQQKSGAGRLARRARAANSLLRRFLEEDSIDIPVKKKGIEVCLISGDHLKASADLDDQLDYTTADDKLVGTVHKYIVDNPDHQVLFLSHDTGPLMTAKRLGVPFQRVSDDWLLSAEADEEQKQIKALQEELRRYGEREPKCQIEFINAPWTFKVPKYLALAEDQIEMLVRKITDKYPRKTTFETEAPRRSQYELAFASVGKRFVPVSADEITAYEDSYDQWLDAGTETFRTLHLRLNSLSAMPWIEIGLTNSGSTPALNVEIRVEVAGKRFFVFAPDKKIRKILEKPVRLSLPPEPPKGYWKDPFDFASMTARVPALNDLLRPGALRDANEFYWKGGRPSEPTYHVSRGCAEWRHQDEQEVVRLCLVTADTSELLNDAVRVTIRATNLSQPVQATQPVRFEFEQLDLLEEAEALVDGL